ncbi:MAG: FAD-dependent oxidoreductase, partial [bacterium]|nr:FAD-dependent oxidoreductase [bacterium]
GGGPAGAAAGVYAARKKINFILLTDTFGGQSVVSDDIQNWIGIPHISGWEMAKRFKKHLEAVGAPFKEGVKISGMKKAEDGFEIAAESSEIYKTKTVLVALGSSRKKLKIPGEAEFNGKGVFYCATCDAPLMKDKISAVIGGGNAAVGAVIDLLSYASKIYLLVRSDILKADPIAVDQIKNKVEIIFNAESQEIRGDKFVESLVYLDKISGEKKELKLDGIFVEIGSRPNSEFLKDLINLNERGEIIVDCRTKKTSCEGVWAAGDITDCLYKQNTISLGDGVVALLNIYDYLIKKIESRK